MTKEVPDQVRDKKRFMTKYMTKEVPDQVHDIKGS